MLQPQGKNCFLILALCLVSIALQAQDKEPENNAAGRRFGLGINSGLVSPLYNFGKTASFGPNFMFYGVYDLSEKWQVEIGFGGVFYNGKKLRYLERINVFDTIYSKDYVITGLAYSMVPILFKYMLGKNFKIIAGARWLGISGASGSGSYGIYSPANKDSFIYKSNINPNLPSGASHLDIQVLAGIELAFSRNFSLNLNANIGRLNIYPSSLTNTVSPLIGNNNNSIEIGLNYTFYAPKTP